MLKKRYQSGRGLVKIENKKTSVESCGLAIIVA